MNMTHYPCRNSRVAARVVDGEAVIVSPDDATLHTLNGVATAIWELADGRLSLEEIAGRIAADYDVSPETALADTRELCDELNRKGVLNWQEAPQN